MIQFKCSHCDKILQTPDDSVGKACRCPSCNTTLRVPADADIAASAQSADSFPDARFPDDGQPVDHESSVFAPLDYNPYAPLPSATSPAHSELTGHSGLRPHRGTQVLLLGIFGMLTNLLGCGCCIFFAPLGLGLSIPAIVMGGNDLKAMQAGLMDPSGQSVTSMGRVFGIIGAVFAVLGFVFATISLVVNFAAMGMK